MLNDNNLDSENYPNLASSVFYLLKNSKDSYLWSEKTMREAITQPNLNNYKYEGSKASQIKDKYHELLIDSPNIASQSEVSDFFNETISAIGLKLSSPIFPYFNSAFFSIKCALNHFKGGDSTTKQIGLIQAICSAIITVFGFVNIKLAQPLVLIASSIIDLIKKRKTLKDSWDNNDYGSILILVGEMLRAISTVIAFFELTKNDNENKSSVLLSFWLTTVLAFLHLAQAALLKIK